MFLKKLGSLFFASFVICSNVLASDDVTTCPKVRTENNVFRSPIFDNSLIAIERTESENYPIALALYRPTKNGLCARYQFAEYSVEGSNPSVDSLFFLKFNGKINLFTIVSWEINNRGAETYGKLYQVYAYQEGDDGRLHENKIITEDDRMTGIDGYDNGEKSVFHYKTAKDVKRAILNHWTWSKG